MPSAFRDIVCNAAATGRPIVVALERSEFEQPDIDAYLASNGDPVARASLLKGLSWQMEIQDGRSSRAFLELIEALRQMKQAGSIRGVVAFVAVPQIRDPAKFSFADHERGMADRLVKAAAAKDTLVLAFVGNVHATRTEVTFDGQSYKPAAALLPPGATFTLSIEGNAGGEAWNCSPYCGVHASGVRAGHKLGLVMTPDAGSRWDALLFLGAKTTASLPAVEKRIAVPQAK
jgi:hypothetical protein